MFAPLLPALDLSPAAQFDLFIGTLFDRGDRIERRMIEGWTDTPPDGPPRRRSRYLRKRDTDLHHVYDRSQFLRQFDRMNAIAEREHGNNYFGVCPRAGYGLGWGYASQIRTVRALWCDLDDCGPDEALDRIVSAGLPLPTLLVSSGNGTHPYWKLATPYRITDAGPARQVQTDKDGWRDDNGKRQEKYVLAPGPGRVRQAVPLVSPEGLLIEEVLAGITVALGGDEHAVDLARILRLPGTMNRKDGRNGAAPKPCVLVGADQGHTVPLDLFSPFRKTYSRTVPVRTSTTARATSSDPNTPPASISAPTSPQPHPPGSDAGIIASHRAERWLDDKAPICVEGQDGSRTACNVARVLLHRFRLSEEECLSLMLGSSWNRACVPPWEEHGNDGLARRVRWAADRPYVEDDESTPISAEFVLTPYGERVRPPVEPDFTAPIRTITTLSLIAQALAAAQDRADARRAADLAANHPAGAGTLTQEHEVARRVRVSSRERHYCPCKRSIILRNLQTHKPHVQEMRCESWRCLGCRGWLIERELLNADFRFGQADQLWHLTIASEEWASFLRRLNRARANYWRVWVEDHDPGHPAAGYWLVFTDRQVGTDLGATITHADALDLLRVHMNDWDGDGRPCSTSHGWCRAREEKERQYERIGLVPRGTTREEYEQIAADVNATVRTVRPLMGGGRTSRIYQFDREGGWDLDLSDRLCRNLMAGEVVPELPADVFDGAFGPAIGGGTPFDHLPPDVAPVYDPDDIFAGAG